jgi:hypothetical protein
MRMPFKRKSRTARVLNAATMAAAAVRLALRRRVM